MFKWVEDKYNVMTIDTPICRICSAVLCAENWYPSMRKLNNRICKKCLYNRQRLWRNANKDKANRCLVKWRKNNPEKAKAIWTRENRKRGMRSFSENKECGLFLGVHIAERVLRHVFKTAKVMPYGNPGYDFVCNHDKKIDVKSSCLHKNGQWGFRIRHNTIADYFLCLAFDNINDLNPLHIWLLPGDEFNHLAVATIRPNTVYKWDAYRLDVSRVVACCNEM